MKLLILFLLTIYYNSFAANDFNDAMDISVSGLKVQSQKLRVIAENLANESSTGKTSEDHPYLKKVVIVKNKKNKNGHNIAFVSKIQNDKFNIQLIYDPSHPAADKKGYVRYPNINPTIETANSKEVTRVYESNLSIFETSKSMYNKTLDLLK